MSIPGSVKRWFLFLFILSALALPDGSAYALPHDPPEPPDPPGSDENDKRYHPQAGGFAWSIESRFPRDANGDGVSDYRYDPAYANPGSYRVYLDGCASGYDKQAAETHFTYRWDIPGTTQAREIWERRCRISRDFLAEGPHSVRLTIYGANGGVLDSFAKTVDVRDTFIVSIGDSYGSGEGNPDVPQQYNNQGFVKAGPRWVDRRCHRSAIAGPAQAARDLENSSRYSSVTFVSVACSGATLDTPNADNPAYGSGVLGPYRGIEPEDATDLIPPQVEQVRQIAGGRRIDALVISVGGNDLQFAKILLDCTLSRPNCHHSDAVRNRLSSLKASLPAKYDRLGAYIRQHLNVERVYLTEYPNLVLRDTGGYCGTAPSSTSRDHNEPVLSAISWSEVEWLYGNLFVPLNTELMPEAARRNGWDFVDGIAPRFGVQGQWGRGYCADDTFFRRSTESVYLQGPDVAMSPLIVDIFRTKGLLHPNARGQQVYKERILEAITRGVNAGPTFDAAAVAELRGHSFEQIPLLGRSTQSNGWFTGYCYDDRHSGDQDLCSSDAAALTIATKDPAGIGWSAATVNGQEGCPDVYASPPPPGGVRCFHWKDPAGRGHRWTFLFTADGLHRLELTATDGSGESATYTHEVRVDLHDPEMTRSSHDPSGCALLGTVEWCRVVPVKVNLEGKDPHPQGGTGLSHFEYRMNGGEWRRAEVGDADTAPYIRDQGVNTIESRAVDQSGCVSPVRAGTVRVDSIGPLTGLTAPATDAPVGGVVPLAATAADPNGVAMVEFLVDGAVVGTDTTAPYQATWNSTGVNGARTVTARAVDSLGNRATAASLAVVVDNVAPTAPSAPARGLVPDWQTGLRTVPIRISWAEAADADSDVARYELQQQTGTGAWIGVRIPPGTATGITRWLTPGTYRFQVRAIDRAGNASAWRASRSFGVGTHQETSAAVTYTGTWKRSDSGAYSGGSMRFAGVVGRVATLNFTGGDVAWIAARSASRGKAEVWLDGARVATVDLYSPALKPRAAVFARAVATGAHKLEVRVLGQKRAEATDTVVDVDAFVVLR